MQPCVQIIGAKNEFIYYPHGVKYEKKFVHYLPIFIQNMPQL